MQPKVSGIKPRKIHQLLLGITSLPDYQVEISWYLKKMLSPEQQYRSQITMFTQLRSSTLCVQYQTNPNLSSEGTVAFPLKQNLSPKVCGSDLHFVSVIHSAVETHTSLRDWSSTRHWMPTLKMWQFADATVYPFPPVPDLLTWTRLDHIHLAAGHRRALYALKMPASRFSLFHFPCLLKIRKLEHFFLYGKAVLPSQFS